MKKVLVVVFLVFAVVFFKEATVHFVEFEQIRTGGGLTPEGTGCALKFSLWFLLILGCGHQASVLAGFRWWVLTDTRVDEVETA